ncbi:MAG: serine/threonine protein kinase [Myxococcales bacterium]|nr:serine/threonine protein kinase [Myxococcales bacterium]
MQARLGVGGMGVVYLAEHPIIGKKVALKVIHRELSANREVIGRFYQEARAVNLIGNEHIVEVHDFGQSPEGDLFFVMEYLDGKTLAQVLTRERILDVRRALHVCAQIADALAAAHTVSIIHRDLKPDNVMLLERSGDPDFVKLLDFGLAKVMSESGAKNLTAAGVILGTPQYMSPEACESKKVDHRTDIYALGVLLFQMLCGQVPFDGETMGAVLIKQVSQPPPAPRGLSPLIPPAVEQIILRCLAKAPDARFQSMAELRAALIDPALYLQAAPATLPAAQPSAAAQAATMYAVETNAAMGYAATAGMAPYNTQAMGAAKLGTAATASHAAVAPPRLTGPVSSQQATMMMDSGPPLGGPAMVGAMAVAAAASPEPVAPRRMTAPPIAVPQNQTLVISTPPGHSRKPPSRRGPLIAVLAVVAVVGVATAVIVAGGGSSDGGGGAGGASGASGEPGASGDPGGGTARGAVSVVDGGAGVAQASPDAGSVGIDAAPATARVTITSDPPGAEVSDATGRPLGVTPVTVDAVVDGQPWTLSFRRAGSKPRDKVITVTGDMTVSVLLDADGSGSGGKRPGGRKPPGDKPGPGPGSGSGSDKIDLMEPTFR